MPFWESSETRQSWRFVMSQNSTAREASKPSLESASSLNSQSRKSRTGSGRPGAVPGGRVDAREKKRNGEVKEPEPKLEVKEVLVKTNQPDGSVVSHRYVVCRNPIQARREAATRAALVARLPGMLRDQGAKTLLKNRSVARLLKARKGAYVLNREELAEAPKYDGIWVVRTNTELDPKDVALRYKQLWMVERTFRTAKSLLDTRPVFHQTDDAIRGHMFCSFLALTLQKALFERLEQAEQRIMVRPTPRGRMR